MSTQFAGLCVGGPYAGKQIVEMTGVFKVQERPQRRLARIDGKVSEVPRVTREHLYRSRMVQSIGLWIHHSLSLEEAMQEIAGGYMTACNQADPRVIPSFRG